MQAIQAFAQHGVVLPVLMEAAQPEQLGRTDLQDPVLRLALHVEVIDECDVDVIVNAVRHAEFRQCPAADLDDSLSVIVRHAPLTLTFDLIQRDDQVQSGDVQIVDTVMDQVVCPPESGRS